MKKEDLRKIIKEEIKLMLKEGFYGTSIEVYTGSTNDGEVITKLKVKDFKNPSKEVETWLMKKDVDLLIRDLTKLKSKITV